MPKVELSATSRSGSSARAEADIIHSFTGQFLSAAELLSRCAQEVEAMAPSEVSSLDKKRHRGFVVGSILQSVAALESEIWQAMHFGIELRAGSNRSSTREFLRPLANLVDRESPLDRYNTVLHLLKKERIAEGGKYFQDARLAIRLRNEIVHYKAKNGSAFEKMKFVESLKGKKHECPPFISTSAHFFPHQCLNAACAAWAVRSCSRFIERFYLQLGIESPLEGFQVTLSELAAEAGRQAE